MQETVEYFVALCMWRFMHVILLKIVDMGTIHACLRNNFALVM